MFIISDLKPILTYQTLMIWSSIGKNYLSDLYRELSYRIKYYKSVRIRPVCNICCSSSKKGCISLMVTFEGFGCWSRFWREREDQRNSPNPMVCLKTFLFWLNWSIVLICFLVFSITGSKKSVQILSETLEFAVELESFGVFCAKDLLMLLTL